MTLVTSPYDWARLRCTVGMILVIAAPAMSFLAWQSTKQPIEVLALAERMRASLPPEEYASALYHGGHAQASLNHMWYPTGFATLGLAGFALGAGLLFSAIRAKRNPEP